MLRSLHLLIVEDQPDLASSVEDYFCRRGHRVECASDGQSGLRMALAGSHDLIILDLGLPRLDGLVLCRTLREAGRGVPILILTARNTLDDKLNGFAEGADDYLVKPFALRELEARVRALVARGQMVIGQRLQCCGLELDPEALIARRAGKVIVLTRTQVRLLACLMRRSPGVVDQASLAREIWGPDGGDAGALHTHIYDLRGLIDKPFESALLHTAHGVGYRLDATA